ncbi:hypothetical protein BH09MYX1_BH09MYX1_19220 [soil metagenome]
MNTKPLLLASLLVALLPACSVDSTPVTTPKELPKASTDFATKQIYPSSSAQDDGANLTVYSALLSGGKFLDVSGTDRLVAKIGDGPDLVMLSQGQTYDPHYVAAVPSTKAAVDVVLTLDRAGTADDAKVTLHLPPAFDLDGTLPSAIKIGTPFTVALVPPPVKEDGVYWAVLEGDCVNASTTAIATIDAGKLELLYAASSMKKDGASSCEVTVKVQHILLGTADAAFVQPSPTDAMGVRERRFTATIAK